FWIYRYRAEGGRLDTDVHGPEEPRLRRGREGDGALGAQRGEGRRPRGVDQDLARAARPGASGCESESDAAGDAALALYGAGGCDRDGGLQRQSSAGGQGPRRLGNDGGEYSLTI